MATRCRASRERATESERLVLSICKAQRRRRNWRQDKQRERARAKRLLQPGDRLGMPC
jgi:hypothetical protein